MYLTVLYCISLHYVVLYVVSSFIILVLLILILYHCYYYAILPLMAILLSKIKSLYSSLRRKWKANLVKHIMLLRRISVRRNMFQISHGKIHALISSECCGMKSGTYRSMKASHWDIIVQIINDIRKQFACKLIELTNIGRTIWGGTWQRCEMHKTNG